MLLAAGLVLLVLVIVAVRLCAEEEQRQTERRVARAVAAVERMERNR